MKNSYLKKVWILSQELRQVAVMQRLYYDYVFT